MLLVDSLALLEDETRVAGSIQGGPGLRLKFTVGGRHGRGNHTRPRQPRGLKRSAPPPGKGEEQGHRSARLRAPFDQRAGDISAGKRFIGPRNLRPDLIYWALRSSADEVKLRNIGGRHRSATRR